MSKFKITAFIYFCNILRPGFIDRAWTEPELGHSSIIFISMP